MTTETKPLNYAELITKNMNRAIDYQNKARQARKDGAPAPYVEYYETLVQVNLQRVQWWVIAQACAAAMKSEDSQQLAALSDMRVAAYAAEQKLDRRADRLMAKRRRAA